MFVKRFLTAALLACLCACSGASDVTHPVLGDTRLAGAPARVSATRMMATASVVSNTPIVTFSNGNVLTADQLNTMQQGLVPASAGASTNQSLTTPTITNGTVTGTDESAGVAKATSGTTSRSHALHYSDATNVMDFGSVASPATDNTTAFQAAITAACAKVVASSNGTAYPSTSSTGAGDVYIPQGRYGVVGPINWTCPIHLRGAGPGNTTLVWTGTGTGTLLNLASTLTDSSRYWYDGAVHDLSIVNGGAQTGAAIRISQCNGCDVYRINTYGMYRSVVNYAGSAISIHDFNFRQMHEQATNGVATGAEAFSTGIELYGSDNNGGTGCTQTDLGNCTTRSDIVDVFDGHIDSALDGTHEASDCLYVHDFVATVWATKLTCNQTRKGLNVRCDSSIGINSCPQFLYLARFENESNNTAGTGTNINLDLDNFAHFACYDCELYQSQVGNNLAIFNSTRFYSGDVEWYGGKVQNTKGACIVSYIDGFKMHGGLIMGCGQSGSTDDEWGIQLSGGSTGNTISTNNSVDNVQFCHDNLGNTTTTMHAVYIGSSTTYSSVSNSNLHNCAGGSSNQNSSGNNQIINELGP
ncbi:hypothetical protein J2D73_16830 [Acetobacter sacchari]|uniref:Rhamnogalacturonase A/B/Epimerase-like pectate lyase domain-containing protein n=1 Tax=Acetobacter sacchari TaxID=2661687 RepID=A0ABS3LZY5_9PROT|nr:glycosyl hydrolase family 28-related protein [Acetobacter sacchari]MBO1361452.1 hypothetical protein [Acetobacter sacchari]